MSMRKFKVWVQKFKYEELIENFVKPYLNINKKTRNFIQL